MSDKSLLADTRRMLKVFLDDPCDANRAELDGCLDAVQKLVEPPTVLMKCLNCGASHRFALDSNEANGVLNVFCNGECEERYAAKH